jgi:hypothetical protein
VGLPCQRRNRSLSRFVRVPCAWGRVSSRGCVTLHYHVPTPLYKHTQRPSRLLRSRAVQLLVVVVIDVDAGWRRAASARSRGGGWGRGGDRGQRRPRWWRSRRRGARRPWRTQRRPPARAPTDWGARRLPCRGPGAPAVELLSGEVQSRMVLSPAPVGPSSAPPAHAPAAPARSGREEVAETAVGGRQVVQAVASATPEGRLPPASSKAVVCPARPGYGTVGRRFRVRANHFLVQLADKEIYHYDVCISQSPIQSLSLSLSLVILLRFGTASIRIRSVWSAISCGCFVVPS